MRAFPFLAAAATAALLAGAASAQETPAQPNMSTTAGRDSTGSPQTTTSAGTTSQSGTTSDASGMPAAAPMAAPSTMANTPGGDAPSSYPVCTHKGQDRCRSTGRHAK